ncbi:protein SHQ1 homolog isoform X1 [Hydra vulgaris]|uniref:protein SHQ1 homolog isoform X2 n=1 Tax=Hydra vulgaris TaxID=6087 RepID=UPI001F5F9814|nr:protein SHQ1 homolog [Hydra vulgaris]
MLTPSFELRQNNDFLILTIKAPYVKANEVEIYIDEYDFKFYVKPYFLRLTFPCKVVENGKENASYDIHKGVFTINIPKLQSGEFFPNLEMLTLLLANKKKQTNKPLVEVLADENSNNNQNGDVNDNDVDDPDDEFTWEIEQTLNSESASDKCFQYKYGFGNKYYGLFSSFKGEMSEVIDLDSPDETTPSDRQRLRKLADAEKFDKDHYIADFLDEELMKPLLEFCPSWLNYKENHSHHEETSPNLCQPDGLIKKSSKLLHADNSCKFEFTEDEKYQLMQLAQNDHILSKEDETMCFLSLVDILLSYCYDIRTTEAEHTTCSAWTISKLSSTLSWLEVHKSLKDVLVSFASRCLCYPLYRNWDLFVKVIDDAKNLFLHGKSHILRCLLDIKRIFQKDENRYLLNELYINDYCVWIQRQSNVKITSLATNIQNTKICKDDVPFNLREIEKEAFRDYVEYESPLNSSIDEDSSANNSSLSEIDSDDTESEDDSNVDISFNLTEKLFSKVSVNKNVQLDVVNADGCFDESKKDLENCENQFNAANNDLQCISTGLKNL